MDAPLRLVNASESHEASRRCADLVTETPLVRLNWIRPDAPQLEIYLKLENLQPVGSFKIRGASNLLLREMPEMCGRADVSSSGLSNGNGHIVVRRDGSPGEKRRRLSGI